MTKKPQIDIKLKKFDMRWVGDNKIIVCIGKRNTGKSYLALDYLYNVSDIPIGTVISPTDDFNQTYKPHVPAIFIHEEYTAELIENILQRQKDIVGKVKNNPEYASVDPRAFLVLDDCLYNSKSWVNDKNIKWIFMNGRHAQITMLLTAQYVMGIPPDLRTNVDYIFICKEPKHSNRKKLYDHYAGMFPTFEMFNQIMTECTDDYGCIVIDNSSTSNKIEDQVYWYRAENHGEFRLCDEMFWQNNDEYAKQKQEDPNEIDNMEKYNMSKSKFNINVIREEEPLEQYYSQP